MVCAEFDEQDATAVWKQLEIRRALSPESVHHHAFETLEANRCELQNFRYVIGCRERVAISEPDKGPMLRTLDQPRSGFEHDGAATFRADECARDVEAVFREQLVEVVA